jgi:hypothetical protein
MKMTHNFGENKNQRGLKKIRAVVRMLDTITEHPIEDFDETAKDKACLQLRKKWLPSSEH